MSNFLPPRYRATDANGEPISGAKLYFYTTGTTTPLATYSDEGLSVANANPVIADGSGYFGAIYLQQAAYRVKLTDSSGTQIYSVDDVRNAVLSNEDFITRLAQVATNPLDYGAVGDGAADESAEVQLAIDAATGVVDLLGKTFRCDAGVTLRTGLTLRNGTLNFSACTGNYGVRILGTSASRGLLASNAAVGATDIVLVSASNVAAGDLILLSKSAVWGSGLGDSGELLRVTGVSTNTVSIAGRVRDTYNTADTATVAEIAAQTQVVIEKVKIVGAESSTGDLALIDAKYADGLSIRDCVLDSFKLAAVRLDSCINVAVSGCILKQGAATASFLDVRGATQDVFATGCQFVDGGGNGIRVGENLATNDWVSRNVYVSGCTFAGLGTNGVFVDKMGQHVRVFGCTFEANAAAGDCTKIDAADDVVLFGNVMRGGDDGIVLANTPTNVSYFGNYFSVGGSEIDGGSSTQARFAGSGAAAGVEGIGGATAGYGVKGYGGTGGTGGYFEGEGAGHGVTLVAGGSGKAAYATGSVVADGYGYRASTTVTSYVGHLHARGEYVRGTSGTTVYRYATDYFLYNGFATGAPFDNRILVPLPVPRAGTIVSVSANYMAEATTSSNTAYLLRKLWNGSGSATVGSVAGPADNVRDTVTIACGEPIVDEDEYYLSIVVQSTAAELAPYIYFYGAKIICTVTSPVPYTTGLLY